MRIGSMINENIEQLPDRKFIQLQFEKHSSIGYCVEDAVFYQKRGEEEEFD